MDYVRMHSLLRGCKRIWEGYKMFAQTAAVSRSGYFLTGVSDEQEDTGNLAMMFCQRGESGLEHQAKVAWLAMAFSMMWEMRNVVDVDLVTLFVALSHDVGEIDIGDIPDDGNARHDSKDEKEFETFKKMAVSFGPINGCTRGAELVRQFEHFQRKDSQVGQFIYALDKLEAVLTLANLERLGHVGSMMSKPHPTEQDLYFVKQTGSDNPVDCWAAHMCSQIIGFPMDVTEPVLTLLDVAINDVRGKSFSWWEKDIPPYVPGK